MQYRTLSQATGSQGPETQFKPYNNKNTMKPPQSNSSKVTANNNNNSRVCFNYRETGHFIANCPYANNFRLLQLSEWAKTARIWSQPRASS
jgi:hypothetical protein